MYNSKKTHFIDLRLPSVTRNSKTVIGLSVESRVKVCEFSCSFQWIKAENVLAFRFNPKNSMLI